MKLLDKFRVRVHDLVRNKDRVHEDSKNETIKGDVSYLTG